MRNFRLTEILNTITANGANTKKGGKGRASARPKLKMGWLIDGLKSVIDGVADWVTDGIANGIDKLTGNNLSKNLHNSSEIARAEKGNANIENGIPIVDIITENGTERIPVKELGIQDSTGTNEEYKVGETQTVAPSSGDNWQKYVEQVEEWRQQDFEREDNKFQRQVKDMRAAGINPNLALGALGGSTASGTSITAPPNTELEAELNEKLALMEQYIDQEFKADENQKDRLTDLIGGIVKIFLAKKLFK